MVNVVRSKTTRGEGLAPRWGGGGAWQNPRCQFAVPSHNSSFSYLGVPAPTGMNDCYESMSRTPIRDRPLRQTLIGRSRHPFVYPAPHFVIPAKSRPRTPIRGRNPEGRGKARPPSTFGWQRMLENQKHLDLPAGLISEVRPATITVHIT